MSLLTAHLRPAVGHASLPYLFVLHYSFLVGLLCDRFQAVLHLLLSLYHLFFFAHIAVEITGLVSFSLDLEHHEGRAHVCLVFIIAFP